MPRSWFDSSSTAWLPRMALFTSSVMMPRSVATETRRPLGRVMEYPMPSAQSWDVWKHCTWKSPMSAVFVIWKTGKSPFRWPFSSRASSVPRDA